MYCIYKHVTQWSNGCRPEGNFQNITDSKSFVREKNTNLLSPLKLTM